MTLFWYLLPQGKAKRCAAVFSTAVGRLTNLTASFACIFFVSGDWVTDCLTIRHIATALPLFSDFYEKGHACNASSRQIFIKWSISRILSGFRPANPVKRTLFKQKNAGFHYGKRKAERNSGQHSRPRLACFAHRSPASSQPSPSHFAAFNLSMSPNRLIAVHWPRRPPCPHLHPSTPALSRPEPCQAPSHVHAAHLLHQTHFTAWRPLNPPQPPLTHRILPRLHAPSPSSFFVYSIFFYWQYCVKYDKISYCQYILCIF